VDSASQQLQQDLASQLSGSLQRRRALDNHLLGSQRNLRVPSPSQHNQLNLRIPSLNQHSQHNLRIPSLSLLQQVASELQLLDRAGLANHLNLPPVVLVSHLSRPSARLVSDSQHNLLLRLGSHHNLLLLSGNQLNLHNLQIPSRSPRSSRSQLSPPTPSPSHLQQVSASPLSSPRHLGSPCSLFPRLVNPHSRRLQRLAIQLRLVALVRVALARLRSLLLAASDSPARLRVQGLVNLHSQCHPHSVNPHSLLLLV
jgi:hypothetical protein